MRLAFITPPLAGRLTGNDIGVRGAQLALGRIASAGSASGPADNLQRPAG